MAQGDNTTETFLEKDVKNDNVPDSSDNNTDSKVNKEKFDNRSVKNNDSLPPGETLQEHNREVDSLSTEKERAKSKPIKLKRKKLEDCHKLLESSDAQSNVIKEEKRKWGERHSRSRSRSSENEETFFEKKKRTVNQKRARNASDEKTEDTDMKDETIESDSKHVSRHQRLDSDSSSDTDDNRKARKRKSHVKRSESSSSDSSSSTSTSSSSDSDTGKLNESAKRKRIEGDKTRSSSAESQSSDKHRKEKSNTSDSSDSHAASRRWERQSKNQTGNSSEAKLEVSHYKSRGSKTARKSPSPRKGDQKRSFNSQKTHSKDSSRKTSPRDKRTGKENKALSSPSAGTDDHGKQCPPEKEKERAAKISKRKLSLSSRKDDHSNSMSERPLGKRRWGSSTKTISKPSLSISTDSLKDLIPDYKPIVKNVVVSSEELNTTANVLEEESSGGHQDANVISMDFTGIEDTVTTESASTKNEGQRDEEVRSPTPPQNPPSCVIHIRNLVRPFTLHQLKEFLKRTGTLVEGGFWIDKIKSKCYVTYETQEQAIETRHALHGTRWPVSNPKTLSVDFATKEELDFHKELPDVSKLQTKKEKPEEKKSSSSSSNAKKVDDEKRRERSERTTQPIREWDRDKLTQDSPDHDWQSKEKSRERGRSPDRRERKDKKDTKRKQEEETPAKLLDDLFRKTKAAPCIYWLPLTEEQIQLRVQDLRQRRLEREKRREQRDRQEKEKEEAERQQRQKARESRSGKDKESSQQSRSPSGRKR